MGATRPVGINTNFATSATSTETNPISQQSDTIRIVAMTKGVHVAIGASPVATMSNYFVPVTNPSEISLGPVASQRVVSYTKGTTTTLDFPEGTGCPFGVGEYVTLTVDGQPAFNFTHQRVQSVNNSAGVGGYFNTQCIIEYNSSTVPGVFSPNYATLRRSIKVAVKTESGTGTVHIQQVQRS